MMAQSNFYNDKEKVKMKSHVSGRQDQDDTFPRHWETQEDDLIVGCTIKLLGWAVRVGG
eukprot:m.337661 g.337661  ORF g.337661 m.337661 type:complete len:59 (-) comp18197_c0_seq1:1047-1223(-)